MSAKLKFCTIALSAILGITPLLFFKANANVGTGPKEDVVQVKKTSTSPTQRNQLEEIFVWKVSDELKLSVAEEKKLGELIRSLASKKSSLNSESQQILDQLSSLPANQDQRQRKLLASYRENSIHYQRLNTEEFDQVKGLLGPSRLVKYLKIKSNISNKVKSLLSVERTDRSRHSQEGSSEGPQKPIPPPKVIEEK